MTTSWEPNSAVQIFTLRDVGDLLRRQKRNIIRTALLGACLCLGINSILFVPKYRAMASFKEGGSPKNSGEPALLSLLSNSSSPQTSGIPVILRSDAVLRPVAERLGLQAMVRQGSRVSRLIQRMKENLCVEIGLGLPDPDPFVFQNIRYEGEHPLHCTLVFHTPQQFSLSQGSSHSVQGSLGTPLLFPEGALTLVQAPQDLRMGKRYVFTLEPWQCATERLRSQMKVSPSKESPSVYEISLSARDRRRGAESLNAMMEEYQNYLRKEYDTLNQEHLGYLQHKRQDIYASLSGLFDEYTLSLQKNLSDLGCLNLEQKIGQSTALCHKLIEKIRGNSLELYYLDCLEHKKGEYIGGAPLPDQAERISREILALRQERDLLEISLTEREKDFRPEKGYLTQREKLKEVQEKHTLVSQTKDSLFDPEQTLGRWASSLKNSLGSQEAFAGYLEKYERLLSLKEKIAEQSTFCNQTENPAFQGADGQNIHQLFIKYNQYLDESHVQIGKFSRACEEIRKEEFEMSALSALLSDPFSSLLIQQTSSIAMKLKDARHTSEKEKKIWQEEMALQKTRLSDHLGQLSKIEQQKIDLIQENLFSLQKYRLSAIHGNLAVLQEQWDALIRQRKEFLSLENRVLEKKLEEVKASFADVPERWRQEKEIALRTEMGLKMMGGVTDLVEAKTIESHLHHIASKPLDRALPPVVPISPRLTLSAALGGLSFGLASFLRRFLKTLMEGFPSTFEKLQAMRYPVLGSISSGCDERASCWPGGLHREIFRKIDACLQKDSSRQVILLAGGKGPDYSYALGDYLGRLGKRIVLIRCDFPIRCDEKEIPGLVQGWQGGMPNVLPRRREYCDEIPSGGFTPCGVELLRSQWFKELVERWKKEYDMILLWSRGSLDSTEAAASLDDSDFALVSVSGEPTEHLRQWMRWACNGTEEPKAAFLTVEEDW